jgi:hypothetical protein
MCGVEIVEVYQANKFFDAISGSSTEYSVPEYADDDPKLVELDHLYQQQKEMLSSKFFLSRL